MEPNASGSSFLAKKALATQGWSTPSVYPVQTNFPMSYIHLPYIDNKVHAVGSNSLCVNKMFSDPQICPRLDHHIHHKHRRAEELHRLEFCAGRTTRFLL